MFRIALITILTGIVSLLSSGCESKSPPTETKAPTSQAAATAKHSSDCGHDHGEAGHDAHAGHEHGETGHDEHAGHDHGEIGHDEHAGHDHGEAGHDDDTGHESGEVSVDDEAGHDHGGHSHGELSGQRYELDSQTIAGLTVDVVQLGAAKDNVAELIFEIKLQGEPTPTAVRLFVLAKDGTESLKVKANKDDAHTFHAHVGELPKKMGEDTVLIVELETPSGTNTLTLPLKS